MEGDAVSYFTFGVVVGFESVEKAAEPSSPLSVYKDDTDHFIDSSTPRDVTPSREKSGRWKWN